MSSMITIAMDTLRGRALRIIGKGNKARAADAMELSLKTLIDFLYDKGNITLASIEKIETWCDRQETTESLQREE